MHVVTESLALVTDTLIHVRLRTIRYSQHVSSTSSNSPNKIQNEIKKIKNCARPLTFKTFFKLKIYLFIYFLRCVNLAKL